MNTPWTGRAACALQRALRLTHESFAEHLGIATRTVAGWHQKPDLVPKSEMQQLLDIKLEQASPAVKARFASLVGESHGSTHTGEPRSAASVEHIINTDPHIGAALDWLDWRAELPSGTSRHRVAELLTEIDLGELRDLTVRQARVSPQQIADALSTYYDTPAAGYGQYVGQYVGQFDGRETATSILTCPEWLDLACPLNPTHDRFALSSGAVHPGPSLDEPSAQRATRRLAETLRADIRLVDMPLYRLLSVDIASGQLSVSLGLTRFVAYALSMDMLGRELVDAMAAGVALQRGALPLRDRYLPNLGTVLDFPERICSGGPLALTAIARPATFNRPRSDYLLLVQERSRHVINAAGRLDAIPKAFHQPITDIGADAPIGATLRREMEEGLFGRQDEIDNTVFDQRRADPMHPSRLSEPMRWLLEAPDRLTTECTGFGINLADGNYLCACLVVIENAEFWRQFGGQIQANWESSSLRQYSSLERDLLVELLDDPAWSTEGLFTFLQSLRRLDQLDGPRTNLPTIEWRLT